MKKRATLLLLLFAGSAPYLRACSVDDPLEGAFCFLARQMDQYHGSFIIYSEPEQMNYFPSGFMGDSPLADVMEKRNPHGGRACLRITYVPGARPPNGWAGIYFQYPENNWGSKPGRDLRGATRLTFWARSDPPAAAEFKAGGINRWPHHDPGIPYQDSFGPVSTGVVELGREWKQHSIDLSSSDLSSAIGVFVWVSNIDQGLKQRDYFLDDITIDLPRQETPRFAESYVPQRYDDSRRSINVAHVYDQALACLAFLARGKPDDLRRAALIADALVSVQEKDRTFKNGRLRNAYASGELIEASSGLARLPGRWDPLQKKFFEDKYAAGSDTGNLAWAGLALVQAHRLLPRKPGDPYLHAAIKIGGWVANQTAVDERQGFFGGVEGFEPGLGHPEGQQAVCYRSTEHNIDLVAFFHQLASAVGEDTEDGRFWRAQEIRAYEFVAGMWGAGTDGGWHLWTGTTPNGTTINREAIPLDIQAWSVLALDLRQFDSALNWALQNCRGGTAGGFDFNCKDGDGSWWEGTSQVVTALRWLSRDQEARPFLDQLRSAQIREGPAAGALPAASKNGLTTGFMRDAEAWTYTDEPHIGATAWYIFALLGKNPYFLAGRYLDER